MAVAESMGASQRRFVVGLNVAVNVLLALIVVALLVWAAGRYGGQVDMSSAGANSLSSRTLKLLASLDGNITLTGLYSTALKEIRPHAEKHRNAVADIFDLYENAADGRITARMIEPSEDTAAVNELLARLRAKPEYADEAKAHIDALARYGELQGDLATLLQTELDQLKAVRAAEQQTLGNVAEPGIIERNLQVLIEAAQSLDADLVQLQSGEIPRYDQAVAAVREHLSQVKKALELGRDWMARQGGAIPGISPSSAEFFRTAGQRYNDLLQRATAILNDTENLEPLKLEEAYGQLTAGQVVVVETADKVAVLSQEDVWPFRTDRNAPPPADGDNREFAGEQAISSAILRLTQTERTAVVFVRFGGMPLLEVDPEQFNPMMGRMPEAPFGQIKAAMERENFIVREWDVQATTDPPVIADAARMVYVVFPPPPQRQQVGQPPAPGMSPEQKEAVLNAVDTAGTSMFLVGWRPPASPFGGPAPSYPYADYLKQTWGVEARPEFLTMQFAPNPDREGVYMPASREATTLTSDAFRFTKQSIAAPLKSLPGALESAVPLQIVGGDAAPEGVAVEPIIETADSGDIWAFSDVMRIQNDFQQKQGTQRYEDDLPAPFPLAVAASRGDAKRLVVIGSEQFASNQLLSAGQLMLSGGGLVVAKLYPANQDLMINALHWLTGEADRIAVGPRSADVRRLDKLEEGPEATFCRVFLVGIWPGLALVAGAVVWLVRRR